MIGALKFVRKVELCILDKTKECFPFEASKEITVFDYLHMFNKNYLKSFMNEKGI